MPEEQSFWEATFAFIHPTLEAIVIDKMVEARDKIMSGEIVVPSAY